MSLKTKFSLTLLALQTALVSEEITVLKYGDPRLFEWHTGMQHPFNLRMLTHICAVEIVFLQHRFNYKYII